MIIIKYEYMPIKSVMNWIEWHISYLKVGYVQKIYSKSNKEWEFHNVPA